MPKITKNQEIAIFSLKEQKKLLTSLDGYKHRMLIILALSTGLRMGELLGLQWNDINFNENSLTVQRAVKQITSQNIINYASRYFLGDLKTKTSARVVPIPINIVKELKLHRRIQNEAKLKCHEIYVDNNLGFANELGELLQISTIQKSNYKNCDDLSSLKIDYNDAEQLLLLNKLKVILDRLESVKIKIDYLNLPIIYTGFLQKNINGRYAIGTKELTSGTCIEALIYDDFCDQKYWVRTRIEHNGEDYYLVGYRDIQIQGLEVRIRD